MDEVKAQDAKIFKNLTRQRKCSRPLRQRQGDRRKTDSQKGRSQERRDYGDRGRKNCFGYDEGTSGEEFQPERIKTANESILAEVKISKAL
jgi:hypothetical protein